jgi:hypothetical protein
LLEKRATADPLRIAQRKAEEADGEMDTTEEEESARQGETRALRALQEK